MPSPREIALKVNRPAGFRPEAGEGVPDAPKEPREKDYRANPTVRDETKVPAKVK